MILSTETLRQFKENGVVALRNVFSVGWVQKLRLGLEYNILKPGPYFREYTKAGSAGRFFGDYCNWRRIKEYEDFVRYSPASSTLKEACPPAIAPAYQVARMASGPGDMLLGTLSTDA